jgi:hypothetical protein
MLDEKSIETIVFVNSISIEAQFIMIGCDHGLYETTLVQLVPRFVSPEDSMLSPIPSTLQIKNENTKFKGSS